MKRYCQRGFLFLLFSGAVFVPALWAQKSQWDGLNQQLYELYRRGHYGEGIPLATEALEIAEATFGLDHPNVAISLNNLAEPLL